MRDTTQATATKQTAFEQTIEVFLQTDNAFEIVQPIYRTSVCCSLQRATVFILDEWTNVRRTMVVLLVASVYETVNVLLLFLQFELAKNE